MSSPVAFLQFLWLSECLAFSAFLQFLGLLECLAFVAFEAFGRKRVLMDCKGRNISKQERRGSTSSSRRRRCSRCSCIPCNESLPAVVSQREKRERKE